MPIFRFTFHCPNFLSSLPFSRESRRLQPSHSAAFHHLLPSFAIDDHSPSNAMTILPKKLKQDSKMKLEGQDQKVMEDRWKRAKLSKEGEPNNKQD